MRFLCSLLFCTLCSTNFLPAVETPSWTLDSTLNGWNKGSLVQAYFHNSELQRQWAWELLGKQGLCGDEQILDFGCGDGKISAELSRFVSRGKVVAVDISEEMISFAKIKFPRYAYPQLEFEQSFSLIFDDMPGKQEYDMVCSFCVFHLTPQPIEILQNLKTHLKTGGKLVLVVPAGKNPILFQAAEEILAKYGLNCPWKGQVSVALPTMRTVEGCKTLLTQAGYKVFSVEMVDTDNPFTSKEELVNWMVGTITANWNIPPELSPAFFKETVERMHAIDSNMIDAEGRVHFLLSRIHAVATVK
jgi:trans-aconitate 2-methyltransferase